MKKVLLFVLAFSLIIFSENASAQKLMNIMKAAKEKAVNKTNQKVDNKMEKGMDQTLDTIDKGIKGIFKKKDNSKTGNTQQNQTPDQQQQGNQNPENANNEANVPAASPALEAYSKYDFIPGERVIFYEDFSQDAIGDFPALWNTNGSAEVVNTNLYPGNWMKFVMNESVWTDSLLKLPDNYTLEYDVIPIGGLEGKPDNMSGWHMRLMQAKNVKAFDYGSAPGNGGYHFKIEYYGTPRYDTWLYGNECGQLKTDGSKDGDEFKEKIGKKYHIAIWVQKTRVRLYQDQNKLFDSPKAFPTGCVKPDRLRFEYGAAMVSNIRIAVGAPDMRNKLMTDGKLVTYGIYFDVNKDVVKPESYGTLKSIAAILNEVPDVKVKVVGHTDSDGADAANLDLSKRRAASVKAELAKSFGVNGDRLDTDGMGESQPVATNDTPVNKALNRRVEFIKL